MSPWSDRISDLPDTLLHHVLSFLPTKEAAATMILSKRWKPLLSIINLDDQNFPDPSNFCQMFNSFTTNRDKTLPIHSLQLICRCNHYCKHDIPNFVNTLFQWDVQNLIIDLSNSLFPTFVITTKFLSGLILKRLLLDDFPSVDLPSLKFLRIDSVTFPHYSYIVKILNACPVLEELETKDVTVKRNYHVEHPDCPSTYVTGLSKLVRANISGRHVFYDCLDNVEHLQLHVTCPYRLDNMFHNLTYMLLALDVPPCLGIWKWNWVMKQLPNCPKLQTLIIHEVDTVHNYVDGEWKDPKIVPECLISHLTACSIRNYSGINWELPFAKYIMQNSRVLSTMTIQVAKSVESDTKIQMCNELSLCPMNSATCELLFI